MSETSEFRRDDALQGDDASREGALTDEGRHRMDTGLTTEQLAEAGAASPAERAASDPRDRDASGMPVAPADQDRTDQDRTDQDRMDQARMDQDRTDQPPASDWFGEDAAAAQGRVGSPTLDSAASAAESDESNHPDPVDGWAGRAWAGCA